MKIQNLIGLAAGATLALSTLVASADDKKPEDKKPIAASLVPATPAAAAPSAPKTCNCPCSTKENVAITEEHHETVTTVVAPPATSPVEVKTAAPTPHHVWTPGTWFWNGVKHLWTTGYWRLPPAPGHTWSAAKWVCALGKCVHTPGRWVTPKGVVLHQPNFYVGVHADRHHGHPAVVVTATIKSRH